MRPCWQFFALVVVLSLLAHSVAADETLPTEERMAYISYVANDAYAIGGRVLGASLKVIPNCDQQLVIYIYNSNASYTGHWDRTRFVNDGDFLCTQHYLKIPYPF